MKNQQQYRVQAAIVIQKCYRGYQERKSIKKVAKRLFQRRKIIQQLVLTQEKYIHDLGVIVSDFQMHLINQKITTQEQNYAIFCNIEAIRKLNQHFFIILYNNFKDYFHSKVIFGDLKKQTHFFKIYFEYLNNFTNSIAKMKDLKDKSQRFREFLINIRKNHNYGNLDLEDYLIKPVQRLPKYVLLFKLLLKKTDQDHPDYFNIKQILESFQEVNYSNNEKLNKVVNNFKLSELQKQTNLPFHIAEPGTQFILQQNVTILTSSSRIQDSIMYLLNNRIILTKKTKTSQKFLQTVNFKHGASIMENEDQQMYEHCFTVQSIDGDSITILFQGEEQKFQLLEKIQKQITQTQKNAYQKYSALQTHNQVSQSFLKKITRFDMMPEIVVLGTQERSDKMLKYTTYIIQVKIKNVRKKIFLRYSELLAIQSLINIQFPAIQIKQSLYKTTWLLNHKPRTIEQRKMSIQRFLKQILSKSQIIQAGGRVLSKLGLPQDLYTICEKLKDTSSMIRKSTFQSKIKNQKPNKSQRQTRTANTKSRKTYRLSIFQNLFDEQQQKPRRNMQSMSDTLKSSTTRKRFNIQQILNANEINLGHYIRYSQNIECIAKNKIKIDIYIPWIQNRKGMLKKTIQILQCQRVSALVKKISTEIGLNYYKDFRLFLEKQYSQRVLDDDEIILKVEHELMTGKFNLVFKKMIYIDKDSEDTEIRTDKLRLKLIVSQIVYDVKKSKYKLNYNKFLIISVLIGIIQHETKMIIHQPSQRQSSKNQSTLQIPFEEPNYKELALLTRQMLANPYASFFEDDKVWTKDFTKSYKNVSLKLKKIMRGNTLFVKHSQIYTLEQEQIWTSLVELSYIGIIDEMKNNKLFGSMCYVVQISQQFREILIKRLKESSSMLDQSELEIETKQNRNVWLVMKCNQSYLYSINLSTKLYQIKYEEIQKIMCYPSSVILTFNKKCLLPQASIKLKTTNSFCIRQLLNYYKNYDDLTKKLQNDHQYSDSILEMMKENQRILNNQGEQYLQTNVEYDQEHLD